MRSTVNFRVWDHSLEKMFYNIENGLDIGVHVPFGDLLKGWPNRKFTVMQFTTALDKNNNKIFEGDIIYNSYGGTIHPVQWMSTGFYMADYIDSDGVWHGGLWVQKDSMEIIGNIHENPEVLCLELTKLR